MASNSATGAFRDVPLKKKPARWIACKSIHQVTMLVPVRGVRVVHLRLCPLPLSELSGPQRATDPHPNPTARRNFIVPWLSESRVAQVVLQLIAEQWLSSS